MVGTSPYSRLGDTADCAAGAGAFAPVPGPPAAKRGSLSSEMKAVVLSAGQGKRLLPLTEETPKCLLPVASDRSMLGFQVEQLAEAGFDDIVVVTGFRADLVDQAVARMQRPGAAVRSLYNPFYGVADNLSSVWLACEEMNSDFLLLNGDTLFHTAALERVLDSPPAPVTVTISEKVHYDSDDMKVRLDDGRLAEIGKEIAPEATDAESIGMILFRGDGPQTFREAVERAMRDPAAVRRWYLSVIDELANDHEVATARVEDAEWCEVDYPVDLNDARKAVARWRDDSSDRSVAAVS